MTLQGFQVAPSDAVDFAPDTLLRLLVLGPGNVRVSLRDDAPEHTGVVLCGFGDFGMLPALVRRVWATSTTSAKLVGVALSAPPKTTSFDVSEYALPTAANLAIAATRSFTITPNDGVDLTTSARWMHVGAPGVLTTVDVSDRQGPVYGLAGGSNILAGTLFDFTAVGYAVKRVRATGTTIPSSVQIGLDAEGHPVFAPSIVGMA